MLMCCNRLLNPVGVLPKLLLDLRRKKIWRTEELDFTGCFGFFL